jgi:hypothetical protein
MVKNKKRLPLGLIAFFQALGLTAYCALIVIVLFNGQIWFNKIPEYFAPLIMLITLSTSALICGLITLSLPFRMFFIEKQPKKAIKLVSFTVIFLVLFLLLFVIGNLLFGK